MPSVRIHFAYRHVDRPWGGANNFVRALYRHLGETGDFTFTQTMEEPCDILFLNQTGRGPGGSGGKIKASFVESLRQASPRKIVVRAVNLNKHAFTHGPRYWLFGRRDDKETLRLLNLADLVIFQSAYQKSVFVEAGYRGTHDIVIHNGADPVFAAAPSHAPLAAGEKLRVVSSTASPRATKQHHLIAALANEPDVELTHFGAWPEALDPGKAKLMGTVSREDIAKTMATSHYFFHPAIKDPCPNAIFEAVCAGLPVIYYDGPGSSAEIVGACGFAMIAGDRKATVQKARESLETLRATVAALAKDYGVGRAAQAYRAAFDSVLSQ